MIKPATLRFIKEVSKNNNREWFADHKAEYEAARADVISFAELLIPELAKIDKAFPKDTQAKSCVLRIYRDVRFSKDKLPYKTNFGIFFAVRGKAGAEPGYYINLEPGNCFFAAGYWMPAAEDLKSIREEIDYNTDEFLKIIEAKSFKDLFQISREDTLKNAPKGYQIDHPQIDLLKLKSFNGIYHLPDTAFQKPDIVDKLKTAFESIYPFILFLKTAVEH
jgi:uncharacterized protein (TIGR02453 family)